MSALFLLLLQFLHSFGLPVDQHGDVSLGAPRATASRSHGTTRRTDDSSGTSDLSLDGEDQFLEDPCDISNGF